MEELHELKERMGRERPVTWEGFPDLNLYMDQVISYLPRQLIQWDADGLTPAMVNNYIKDGLLPRAEGKKYSRSHLAYLTVICALKQVLSVREMKVLISAGRSDKETDVLYNFFRQELDAALSETAEQLDESVSEEELPRLALGLALRSYADKLACERILDILKEKNPGLDRGRK